MTPPPLDLEDPLLEIPEALSFLPFLLGVIGLDCSISYKSSIPGNGVAGSTSSSILTSPKFFAEIKSFRLYLDDPPPIEDALPILGAGELK